MDGREAYCDDALRTLGQRERPAARNNREGGSDRAHVAADRTADCRQRERTLAGLAHQTEVQRFWRRFEDRTSRAGVRNRFHCLNNAEQPEHDEREQADFEEQ